MAAGNHAGCLLIMNVAAVSQPANQRGATYAAALAAFPTHESLRRVFARELSISPAACQRRFSTARRPNPQ